MKRVCVVLMGLFVGYCGLAKARPSSHRAFNDYRVMAGISPNISDFSRLYGQVGFSWHALNSVELQAIAGYPVHYSLGVNFHPNTSFGSGRISPYAGIAGGQFQKVLNANVPIGFTYVAPVGFTLGLGLRNYFFISSTNEEFSQFESFLELNMGWSF